MCQNNQLVINDLCAKFDVNQPRIWLLLRQCPLKHKGCLLKCPSSGIVPSFQIQLPKATDANEQKNDSAEESTMWLKIVPRALEMAGLRKYNDKNSIKCLFQENAMLENYLLSFAHHEKRQLVRYHKSHTGPENQENYF